MGLVIEQPLSTIAALNLLVTVDACAPDRNRFVVLRRPAEQHSGEEKDKRANGCHRQQCVKDEEQCQGKQGSRNKIQLL